MQVQLGFVGLLQKKIRAEKRTVIVAAIQSACLSSQYTFKETGKTLFISQ